MASEYLRQRQEKELKQYNDEMALRAFRQKYKPQIEDGLTEQQFRESYRYTQEDIDRFRQIEQEVQAERREGELFMKGFNSVGGYGR